MYITLNNQKIYIKIAQTMYTKMKGLLGIKNINFGLLIPKCNGIHTFGMKDNIDVLALDERRMVFFKYQNMPPNKIVMLKNEINKTSILELPKNTSNKIRIGDILTFEYEHII